MRILHVAHCLPPNGAGGVQFYTIQLATAQAAAGAEVGVYARGVRADVPDGTEEEVTRFPGLRVVESHLGPGHQHTLQRVRAARTAAFRRFLNDFRPDVVHFHHLLYHSLDFPQAARDFGAATLLTVHDLWFDCPVVQRVDFRGALCTKAPGRICLACVWNGRRVNVVPRETIRRLAESNVSSLLDIVPTVDDLEDWISRSQTCLDAVDTVITPSNFVRDNLAEHGLTHPRFVLLDNGLRPPGARLEADTPDGVLRFGFLGTHPLKGTQVAIDAFHKLTDVPGVRLLCYGGGLDSPIGDLPPNIVNQGRFDPADIEAVYASFDVLIVPSTWWENAPIVIREAFGRGKPVIASDLGGMAESVRDGVDGLLFPVGDSDALAACVCRLADEPGLLDRLRASIRPPVPLETHVADLGRLYDSARSRREPS